ncbi:hypothetical protein BDD43_1277 [Mucilaginibacter gracilis]|uniref:Tetratricopeptide repeat protein n=1 Tax=Mucilaginibacter gracilis TaxID=423350 RepID=A0A495IXA3_9SPHI|nr:hypothetical protein [Mucilaginibacter gracilis]RKR81133.1 hypothetical protein BDD43_1277 [Mucilaginibacter gracilis]
MKKHFFRAIKAIAVFVLLCTVTTLRANINAIELNKVGYPQGVQPDIDFLKNNQGFYNHWVHNWNYKVPKNAVIKKLTGLYTELKKLPAGNIETNLLIGDIAHYLYNMEVEEYYQKAIDCYEVAKALSPTDYRVYWFLGNHYALSARIDLSFNNYRLALQYQQLPVAHALFWADYAVACTLASMPATALFAAEKSSTIQGETSYIEKELAFYKKGALHAPPVDTTIAAKNMWFMYGTNKSHVILTNWVMGTKLSIDSTWGFRPNDYKGGQTYTMITPPRATAKSGQKIGFSILMFTRAAKPNQSLSQFMDLFTAQYTNRKPISFTVGQIKNGIAYEIIDPTLYPQIGGGHSYAIAFERSRPAYPGMLMEDAVETPKANGSGDKIKYYADARKFSRFDGKLYYFILLDSCEFINAESLATFKDFVENGVIIE